MDEKLKILLVGSGSGRWSAAVDIALMNHFKNSEVKVIQPDIIFFKSRNVGPTEPKNIDFSKFEIHDVIQPYEFNSKNSNYISGKKLPKKKR